jgi:predicted  nucleic acid-binding Zn-ribbon protein
MEKLKQDLGLLKEKSGSAKAEIKELRLKLKEKRRNGSSDFDGIFTLRNALKEKKQSWFQIFKEVKMTRYRIRKLHNLAETKTV